MTYLKILEEGKKNLRESDIEEADNDAWVLFSECFKMDRSRYILCMSDECPDDIAEKYFDLIRERMTRRPLQYIMGKAWFMGLEFTVGEGVLIPRFDTEILVSEALKYVEGKRVLDLCTGSGCIAISLMTLGRPCGVVAADISDEALGIAAFNNEKLADNRVKLIKSDMFSNVDGCFDVIVSNPPYIKSSVIGELMPEVKDHEPGLALDGGGDGMYFYRLLTKEACSHLLPGGLLIMEIGYDQAFDVTELLKQYEYKDIRVIKDFNGLDRVALGWRK